VITNKQFDTDVEVSFSVGGTATAGSDYTTLSSPVTFPAYSDTLRIVVPQLDDSESEMNEYVIMNLTGTDNSRVSIAPAPDSTATVTVFDDDLPLAALSHSDASFSEGGGRDLLEVSLNKVHHDNVIVTLGLKQQARPPRAPIIRLPPPSPSRQAARASPTHCVLSMT
jgi:hypothetical protein